MQEIKIETVTVTSVVDKENEEKNLEVQNLTVVSNSPYIKF